MTVAKRKILVVEDDPGMADVVVHKLNSAGFDVKHASDGKMGIDMAITEKPDLILLDLMLPEVDGFRVLETLRKDKDPKVAGVPIIVMSNLWSDVDILKTKAHNISGYLVKAYFTTEEILEKVREALKK